MSSLQVWLTRKQRETRRGRAELRLASITNLWKDRPSTRRLPSALEWIEALAFTRPKSWLTDERRMIHAASRHYLTRLALAACLIIAATYAVREFRERERSTALFARRQGRPSAGARVARCFLRTLAASPRSSGTYRARAGGTRARTQDGLRSCSIPAIRLNGEQPSCPNPWSGATR